MANKRYGMVIDLRKCAGCHACTVACKAENKVPDGIKRTKIIEEETGEFPNVAITFRKHQCMHCQDAPCVKVCPTKASYHTEFGTCEVDPKLCIGCKYCVHACPYRARTINPENGLPEKCTLCVDKLAKGELPACATTCIGNAITVGDLNDPNSEVSRAVAKGARPLNPEWNTKPSIFYIWNRR
ncbi:MAG: 4Fe-4S dicluster domain-containing protein [Firmicutes bacterium]|nr:4Fe-4S dicluster domain-containing protein [Bacillota bacterium]